MRKLRQKRRKAAISSIEIVVDIKECRICLDSCEDNETGELASLCGCRGSLKWIHKQCLWLQLTHSKSIDKYQKRGSFQVTCKLCMKPFQFKCRMRTTLTSLREFRTNLARRWKEFFAFTLAVLFSSAALIFFLNVISEGDEEEQSSELVVIAYVMIYFAFIAFILSTIVFVLFLKERANTSFLETEPHLIPHQRSRSMSFVN